MALPAAGEPSRNASGFATSRTVRSVCAWALLLGSAIGFAELARGQAPGRKRAKRSQPAKALVQPVATFHRFPDWVEAVAFSPDSRTLAAGSYGVVKLFDAVEHRETGELAEPAGFVKALAFSPDGALLATGSYQSVTLWNVAEGKPAHKLKGHRGYVTAAAFSPDGKTLATASDDETVRLWDVERATERPTLSGIEQPALGLDWSRDGELLAVALGDETRPTKKGAALVFDAAGNERFALEGHDRAVGAVEFSPDGTTLATASHDETIRLWNTADGSEVRALEGHSRPVNALAFLPDGKWLASVCGGRNAGGNEIKLWNLESGKDALTLGEHGAPIRDVAVSPDGKLLATAGMDKSVRVWSALALVKAAGGSAEKAPADGASPERPEPVPVPEGAARAGGLPRLAAAAFALAAQAPGDQLALGDEAPGEAPKMLRAGIIGLDTSHATAFTQILNDPQAPADVADCRVVAAYPRGSPDIESSVSRVPEYTKKVQEMGVEIVDSIPALLEKVDVVLLETNDGRPHLEQAIPVLEAGKPVFIDKPVAGSLADAVAIYELARKHNVPVFSSSSLRYASGAQAIRGGKAGEVKGADAYSPCSLEATHPDLFWYGIHGVETLFTVMGAGCESVSRTNTPGIDLAVGVWKGGRVGTFRGIRPEAGGGQAGYGGTVFGTGGIVPIGSYDGYRPLVVEIVKFFRSGKPPVTEEETLEVYAFMEAADESKRQGGKPVTIESVLTRAREAAKSKTSQ